MSRYTGNQPDAAVDVAYGYDNTLGFWVDVLDASTDEPIIEENSLFTGLTGVGLREHLAALDVVVPDIHRTSMLLDIPF